MVEKIWLTPLEAAPVLGLSGQAMYDKLRRDLLPPSIRVLRIGRQYRIHAGDLGLSVNQNSEKEGTGSNQALDLAA